MTSTPLRGERVLVTGGAGTIGSHLVDQLVLEDAAEIIVVDNFVRGRRENLNECRLQSAGPDRRGRYLRPRL